MSRNVCVYMILAFAYLNLCACRRATEVRRERNETEDLRIKIHDLEQKVAILGSAKEAAEREAREWRDHSRELEEKLHSLQPEILPAFEARDLSDNTILIQRVYSIRTGQCFNRKGEPSCLYLKLSEDGGLAFVVYKANRVFLEPSKLPALHNSYGQQLSVVTGEIAPVILAWEKRNVAQQIRLESY